MTKESILVSKVVKSSLKDTVSNSKSDAEEQKPTTMTAWEVVIQNIDIGCRIEGFSVSTTYYSKANKAFEAANAALQDYIDNDNEHEEDDEAAVIDAQNTSWNDQDSNYGWDKFSVSCNEVVLEFDSEDGVICSSEAGSD